MIRLTLTGLGLNAYRSFSQNHTQNLRCSLNIAFLFNSDHKSLDGWYGYKVMKKILGTMVLQETQRHMRISIGDILTYGAAAQSRTPTIEYWVQLNRAVYRPARFNRLIDKRLEASHGNATVYCWLFQNMTASIAESLHSKLSSAPYYLGAMDVVFSEPLHLRFFRNSLCENYRLYGKQCSMFYSMGENEDPDVSIENCFKESGFVVNHEDTGARRTIFDDFDSLDHFRRIEDFKNVFAGISGVGEDRASDLVLNLEEVHPKLFDAFASAARTLARAETEEDYAQVALSGRRLLERLADYLFPPTDKLWNGRKVGRAEYKNRLWAYLESTLKASGAEKSRLSALGTEADRLVELFNAGLHAAPSKQKVEAGFVSLVSWLSDVIAISPASVRKPYLAYDDSLRKFLGEVVRDSAGTTSTANDT